MHNYDCTFSFAFLSARRVQGDSHMPEGRGGVRAGLSHEKHYLRPFIFPLANGGSGLLG